MKIKKIVITIPAYNEEKSIGLIIDSIKQAMHGSNYKYQILVIDDGSIDKTKEIAEVAGALVYSHPKNYGLAETFRTEMRKCIELKADIIVHTDADGQYPSRYIPELIKEIENGYDLVLGSRFGKGKYSGAFGNKIGNILFAKIFSSLLKTKLSDTTTGFRAFNKEIAKLPITNDFTYTQEQLIRAAKSKMKIKSISIDTNKTRKSRLFKNPFNYAIRAWINIFKVYRDYAPIKFFGIIGSLFLAIGILLGVWVLINIITIGHAGGIPRVILSALFIMTGIQVFLFGFLADMIKK